MSYVPTAEKLATLGFKHADAEGYMFEREAEVAHQLHRYMVLTQRKDGRMAFYEHYFASGPVREPGPATVFCSALPSEEFFDLLLVALGWLTTAPLLEAPDLPASWEPVQPGQVGVFLTRNGKYVISAEPVCEWKIAKYGLVYWLCNAPANPAAK